MKTQPLSPSIVTVSDLCLKPSQPCLPELRTRGVFEGKSLDFDLCSHETSDLAEAAPHVPKKSPPTLPPVKLSDRSGERPFKALAPREFFIPFPENSTFDNDPKFSEEHTPFDNDSDIPGITSSLSKLSLSLVEDSFQSSESLSNAFIFKPYRGKCLMRNNSSVESLGVTTAVEHRRSNFESPSSQVRFTSQNSGQSSNELKKQSDTSKEVDPLSYQVHNRILGWKLTSVQRRQDLINVLEAIHNPDDPRLKLQSRRFNRSMTPSQDIDPEIQERLSRRRGESVERFLSRSLQKNESLKLGTSKPFKKQHNRGKNQFGTNNGLQSKEYQPNGLLADDEFQRMVSKAFEIKEGSSNEDEIDQQRNLSNHIPVNIFKRRDRMDIIESVRFHEANRRKSP